ncbi:MAG: hypothetical protein QXG39_01940 [Candidatus Aenigmatarchaeota archaeon]
MAQIIEIEVPFLISVNKIVKEQPTADTSVTYVLTPKTQLLNAINIYEIDLVASGSVDVSVAIQHGNTLYQIYNSSGSQTSFRIQLKAPLFQDETMRIAITAATSFTSKIRIITNSFVI